MSQIIRPYILRQVINEIPAGLKNGVNQTYTTAFNFIINGVSLYLNGVKQTPGVGNDFVANYNTQQIVFQSYAPASSDVLLVEYLREL